MNKKVIACFMSIVVMIFYIGFGNMNVIAEEVSSCGSGYQEILNYAKEYAQEYYMDMVQTAVEGMQEEMGISISDMSNISMGEPYYIYDIQEDVQTAEFYFPIYDQSKVILILHTILTDEGWKIYMDTQNTSVLNDINYKNTDCIFYRIGENVYVENDEQTIQIQGSQYKGNVLKNRNLIKKQIKIEQEQKYFIPVELKNENKSNMNTGATGGSVNTSTGKYLAVNNYYTGQGKYELCWAASIATTYRYRTNSNLVTAIDIAKQMGEKYTSSDYTGANDTTIIKAFKKYNLDYKSLNKTPSWSTIKRNINNEYPIAIVGRRQSGGTKHMVLITAYNAPNGNYYVKIWDPKDEDTQLARYETGKVISFESNGNSWYSNNAFLQYK